MTLKIILTLLSAIGGAFGCFLIAGFILTSGLSQNTLYWCLLPAALAGLASWWIWR